MNQQELDHQTAVTWITTELKIFAQSVGERNASAAVRSVLDLALLLRAISVEEKRAYAEEISRIHSEHAAQLMEAL